MSDDRGPVPDGRPKPPCFGVLPAAVVLTVVAAAAHWLGVPRRLVARGVALGAVLAGLVALLAGVWPALWGYDVAGLVLLGALLFLYVAASAVLSRPGCRGVSGRVAAAVLEGAAAANPEPAAVTVGSPGLRSVRHRRLFRSGAPPGPVDALGVPAVATAGGAPIGGAR